jgi:NAD(P)-dependent dehydrogenase (short-subunit alcohol dehydrogenase family)
MPLFDITGRVAVVVGASGVLASAMARGLARAGARLALVGRSAERLGAVGLPEARVYLADATRRHELERARDEIVRDLGGVDVLVSAVGGNVATATTAEARPFFTIDPGAFEEVVRLNLMAGAVLPAQAFGPRLVESPHGGSIIHVSSMSALRPLTRVGGYSAAKAAVDSFTRWLAVELAADFGERIRVNAIAPGFFLTAQNRALLTTPDGGLTPRAQSILAHTPMRRFGTPDDLLGALIWLASDASRFVTGTVIPVDGGFSAFSGV